MQKKINTAIPSYLIFAFLCESDVCGAVFCGKMVANEGHRPPFFRKKQLRTHHFHTIIRNIR